VNVWGAGAPGPAHGVHSAGPASHRPRFRSLRDKIQAFWRRQITFTGSHKPSPQATVLHVVVFELVLAGIFALAKDLTTAWRNFTVAIVGLVILVRLLPLHRWLCGPGKVIEAVGAMIGLLVIPVFALIGIDAALAQLGFGAVGPIPGLIVAIVLLLGVARVYLEPIWTGFQLKHPLRWSFAAALCLALLPLVIIFAAGAIFGDGKPLSRHAVVSRLDVIVVRAGGTDVNTLAGTLRRAAERQRQQERQHAGWRVTTWTGRVDGNAITWDGGRAPTLSGQVDTDRVLLLVPPAEDNAHPERWIALADRLEPKATPTYALLDDPTPAELAVWRRPLSGTVGRSGDALPIADVGGRTASASELGIRAATQEPGAATDLALALAHRPILQFDGGEQVFRPLDVDEMFETGAVRMCQAGAKHFWLCQPISSGSDLQTGFDHLAFDTNKLADSEVDTRIYFHATRVYPEHRPAEIDLDYWWYLPDNPARSGSGAFCGPGFEIAGATCFDHQSDWEGVTVVLDPAKPDGPPVAVNYAQHDGSFRYTWPALESLWKRTHAGRLASAGDRTLRPLVFSARGTHASYPVPCAMRSCPRNVVPGLEGSGTLTENPRNGAIPWLPNDDGRCAGACVAALPVHRNGTEAQGWNAWDGTWGSANCVVGSNILCASATPPVSPGQQPRYEHPWCTAAVYGVDAAGKVVPVVPVPHCAKEPVAGGDLTRGGTLLALGDSYSSGEGAGHYEPGTDTSANTCHRSANAWPTLLADRRHMSARPSLACSGARVADVLTGHPSGEAERRRSQIGRITGNPDVITITVGGNDLGFIDVLENCMALNCVNHYHLPTGDELDKAIDRLARDLPAAYRRIQAAAPAARVVVVDYPKLFPDSDPANPTPNCAADGLITPAEGNYLNDKVERADVAILDAARLAGVTAVDVSTAMEGGELSCAGTQYINHASPQLKVLSGSFHPNAAGQDRLASAVNTALSNLDH
jgi:lysophospholipase L1-like esterase